MAEASVATAFRNVGEVGEEERSWETTFRQGRRFLRRRALQAVASFRAGIYPATPGTLLLAHGLVGFAFLARMDGGAVGWLAGSRLFVGLKRSLATLISLPLLSCLLWAACVQVIRGAIGLLLSYDGHLNEAYGCMSTKTKLWLAILQWVAARKPMLLSFQSALPRLPLPALEDTLARHLRTLRPVLSPSEYAEMERLSEEFSRGLGPRLQMYLWLRAWNPLRSNYVSEWWEKYVYLASRGSLATNSNYYGCTSLAYQPTKSQTARAAGCTYSALLFRRLVRTQRLEPVVLAGVPFCSAQYARLFDTTRVPGDAIDVLKTYTNTQHIIVHHRGRWFRLPTHNGERLMSPAELECGFKAILADASEATEAERQIAALTAAPRSVWAKNRRRLLANRTNRRSVRNIESGAFIMCLAETSGPADLTKFDDTAKGLLHGDGTNLWFDKSLQFIIFTNCFVGANIEHTYADAPVALHMVEQMLHWEVTEQPYAADGSLLGDVGPKLPRPMRLRWDLQEADLAAIIQAAYVEARALCEDIRLAVLFFMDFGKEAIKGFKVSPDAFVQMAIQTSFHRLHGRLALTYESAVTRRFVDGRTETVRSLSPEMAEFVQAFTNPSVSAKERLRLMRIASTAHQGLVRSAMGGQGVDRHLFALAVVSEGVGTPSPFLRRALELPWTLSTSQTPLAQAVPLDIKRRPELMIAGGGFGPVAKDGYGIAYIVASDDRLLFHISSRASSTETNAYRLREAIEATLRDFRSMAIEGMAA